MLAAGDCRLKGLMGCGVIAEEGEGRGSQNLEAGDSVGCLGEEGWEGRRVLVRSG